MISYTPLWVSLAKKELKKMDLRKLAGISNGTLSKLSKNEYVALSVIEKICISLDCEVGDVIKISSDTGKE